MSRAFSAIASCVESDGSPAEVIARLRAAWSRCDQDAAALPDGDARRRLANVQQALETWQRVWPRLGTQRDFRAAVVREARLWAKTFAA
ncbi:MAG: hypothetical protein HY599_02640 [Candidatus Omnitrophica bacterium]|nr:hypothetical protein [Candidatus Omnitrophota bacterium]